MTAGAPYTWITLRYGKCLENAPKERVQQHARAYVWYVISRTVFADSGGNNAAWMWLKALTSWDSKISWGSATLAYLYHQVIFYTQLVVMIQTCNFTFRIYLYVLYMQLDEACRRTSAQDCIGGPLLLLTIWMWSCISIGRPVVLPHNDWEEDNIPLCGPTWAYLYDVVEPYVGSSKTMYKYYSNEFDALTTDMVKISVLSILHLVFDRSMISQKLHTTYFSHR
jgi:hypothetical protein